MPLRHSNEDISQWESQERVCTICISNISAENLFTTHCAHNFHSSCITTWLKDNNNCPVCKAPCNIQTLEMAEEQAAQVNVDSNSNRGAIPKNLNFNSRGPRTRSQTNNGHPTGHNASPGNIRIRGQQTSNRNTSRLNSNNNPTVQANDIQFLIQSALESHHQQTLFDMQNIARDIATEVLSRNLESLRIGNEHQNLQSSRDLGNNDRLPSHHSPNVRHRESLNNAPVSYANVQLDSNVANSRDSFSPSMVSKIITNWKLTFDGSIDGISVNEFIYRVNSLTRTTLRGNFDALCENAHILFEGKAKRWYWRYHHSVTDLDWMDICDDLLRNFKDFRSDFEIKESMRTRKQKIGESFESYLDGILKIADSLRTPLPEHELVPLVIRNLNADTRLALLHLDITTISDLRKACRRRENFYAEVQSKAQLSYRGFHQKSNFVRHANAELEIDNTTLDENVSVEALRTKDSIVCWNCDTSGHSYKNCVKPRRVFCYGCGLLAYFLPNCPKCNISENRQKDVYNSNRHPKTN